MKLYALNNKLNRLHEKYLRLNHNDKGSTFKQLVDKDSPFLIHVRNLQTLAIETHKVMNGGSLLILNEIFKLRDEDRSNLWYQNTFKISLVNIVYNGTETILFFGPKMWELIPIKTKD